MLNVEDAQVKLAHGDTRSVLNQLIKSNEKQAYVDFKREIFKKPNCTDHATDVNKCSGITVAGKIVDLAKFDLVDLLQKLNGG